MIGEADRDDAFAGFVGFIIAWCIFGILGLIPWNHPSFSGGSNSAWKWHMSYHNAWLIWALFVTMGAIAIGFIVYAVKRWG